MLPIFWWLPLGHIIFQLLRRFRIHLVAFRKICTSPSSFREPHHRIKSFPRSCRGGELDKAEVKLLLANRKQCTALVQNLTENQLRSKNGKHVAMFFSCLFLVLTVLRNPSIHLKPIKLYSHIICISIIALLNKAPCKCKQCMQCKQCKQFIVQCYLHL